MNPALQSAPCSKPDFPLDSCLFFQSEFGEDACKACLATWSRRPSLIRRLIGRAIAWLRG